MYEVNIIKDIKELSNCPVFHINNYQWTNDYRPQAFGQMALLKDYGIVISMTALERDPLRRYTNDDDPVFKDNGLEAFLNFDLNDLSKGYFNFEMNAYGAMLSEFGIKGNRKKIRDISAYRGYCEVINKEDEWGVLLKVPMELICEIYGIEPLKEGDVFTCNFYKISEDPSIEHYASYSLIESEIPNFHLPTCFAKAVVKA